MSFSFKRPPSPEIWARAMKSLTQPSTPRSQARVDMSRLNERQQQAVQYAGSNPLMILAAPGSGKTATLTMRIAYLIDEMCIPASSILAVTFTRNAGNEMRNRIKKLLAHSASISVQTSTFHQLCLQIIRNHHRHCGFTAPPKIVDKKTKKLIVENSLKVLKTSGFKQEEYDWEEIGSKIVAELQKAAKKENLDEDDDESQNSDIDDDEDEADRNQLSGRSAEYFVNFIGKTKRLNQKPTQYEREHAFVLQAYTAALKSGQMIDLDDFIPMTVQLFQENPKVLEIYRNRWTHVLVDEFQDVSPNQLDLIVLLRGKTGYLTVCGDEDQSIYGFRSGSSHTFKMLQSLLPNLEIIVLDQTYRSTPQIIRAADSLIRFNSKRTEKKLTTKKEDGASVKVRFCYDDQAEIRDVVTQILHYHNDMQMELSEIAVLCRVRQVLNAFIDAFRQANIPFELAQDGDRRVTNGKKLPKLTRRIFAFCELMYLNDCTCTQFHEAFFEAIKGTKGIGKRTIENIKEHLNRDKDILKAISRLVLSARPSVKQKLSNFLSLIRTLKAQASSLSVVQSIELIDQHAKCSSSKDIVQMKKLTNAAKEADNRHSSLEAFCHQFKFDHVASCDKDADQPKQRVSLSTVHQAKGKEWDCVFVVHFNEGTLPLEKIVDHNESHDGGAASNSALDHYEEERRICYVALTRAKSYLYFSYVQYNHRGESSVPSRFLEELPKNIEFWEPKGDHKTLQRQNHYGGEHKLQLSYQENRRTMQTTEKASMWKTKESVSGFQSASSLMSNGQSSQISSNAHAPQFQSARSLLANVSASPTTGVAVPSTFQSASSVVSSQADRQRPVPMRTNVTSEMQPVFQQSVDCNFISNKTYGMLPTTAVRHPSRPGYVREFQYVTFPNRNFESGPINQQLSSGTNAVASIPHPGDSYQSRSSPSTTQNYSQIQPSHHHILPQTQPPVNNAIYNRQTNPNGKFQQKDGISQFPVTSSEKRQVLSVSSTFASSSALRYSNNISIPAPVADVRSSLPVFAAERALESKQIPNEFPSLSAQPSMLGGQLERATIKVEPAISNVEQKPMAKKDNQFLTHSEASRSCQLESDQRRMMEVSESSVEDSKPLGVEHNVKVEGLQIKRPRTSQRSSFLSFTKPRMRSL